MIDEPLIGTTPPAPQPRHKPRNPSPQPPPQASPLARGDAATSRLVINSPFVFPKGFQVHSGTPTTPSLAAPAPRRRPGERRARARLAAARAPPVFVRRGTARPPGGGGGYCSPRGEGGAQTPVLRQPPPQGVPRSEVGWELSLCVFCFVAGMASLLPQQGRGGGSEGG